MEDNPRSWVEGLVDTLFERVYTILPFDSSRFPRPLTSDDVPRLYAGLLQGDDGARDTVADFAPGLGLIQTEEPLVFNPTGSCIMDIIRQEVEAHGGNTPASEVLSSLVHIHGLTEALAALYILAFVRHARAEMEFKPHHNVQLTSGKPFLGDRLAWDLIPEISYHKTIADSFATLHIEPSLSWNTILAYARLVVTDLEESQDQEQIAIQERRLLSTLASLGAKLEEIRRNLQELADELIQDASHVSETLDHLGRLFSSTSYLEFYTFAQGIFQGPSDLGRALESYDRLIQVANIADEVVGLKTYLDGMTFGERNRTLALDHASLLGRLDLSTLALNPILWREISTTFEQFRSSHENNYKDHHTGYHREALALSRLLERIRPQAEALERFNTISELGEPVGSDVLPRLIALEESLKKCPVSEEELSLEDAPYCQTC